MCDIVTHEPTSGQVSEKGRGSHSGEQRIRTEPVRFAAVLGIRPRARIVIEASTDSEWVARCLAALGHEVIVADPNFAPMYATRVRSPRRNYSAGIAPSCAQTGSYQETARRLRLDRRTVKEKVEGHPTSE